MRRQSHATLVWTVPVVLMGLWGGSPVAAQGHGDLVVIVLSVLPDPSNLGTQLTAQVQGWNASTAGTTYTFRIDFWEHRATAPTGPSGSDANWSVSGIDPLAFTDTFTHTFTPSTSGTFRAWAMIDSSNVVPEPNETNNTRDEYYTVNPMPDLTVPHLSLSPSQANLGATITATVRGQNQGTSSAGPFYIHFWKDRSSPPTSTSGSDHSWSISGLAADSLTAPLTYGFTPSAKGQYEAWAFIDSTKAVAEANEGNNTKGEPYEVEAPDLIVSSMFSVTPDPSVLGTTIGASVRGYNQGNGYAGTFRLSFWEHRATAPTSNSGEDAYWTFSNLAPLSYTSSQTYTFTPSAKGSYQAWAFVDSTKQVTESQETNNTRSNSYTVKAPDLTVTSLSVSPDPSRLGMVVEALVGVENEGDASAGAFRLSFWKHRTSAPTSSSGEDAFWTCATLGAGAVTGKSYHFTPSASGMYEAWAFADSTKTVPESDEANNTRSDEYYVSAPDLVVSSLSVTPDPSALGAQLSASLTGYNDGDGYAGGSRLCFWEHRTSPPTSSLGADHSWDLPGLNPHGCIDRTYTFTPSAKGSYEAWALIDSEDWVQESIEANNTASDTYVVQAPDYQVSSLSVSPDPSALGTMLSVSVSVRNEGNCSGGACYVHVWRHRETAPTGPTGWTAEARTPGALSPGQQWVGTLGLLAILPGSFQAWALADSANEVVESDETNNARSDAYVVQAPDVVISALSVSPDPSTLGDELTATINGRNNGDGDAGAFDIDFWQHAVSEPTDATGSDGSWPVSSLAAGAEIGELTYSFTPASVGSYTAWALIDSGGVITESDETNNAASDSYRVEYRLQPDVCVRGSGDATWIGEDYYGRAGRQMKVLSIDPGRTGVFHVSIENDGQTDDSLVVRGRAGTDTWPVKYYDAVSGGNDITAEVSGEDGWMVGPLAPGAAVPMRCEMTAPPDAIGNSRRSRIVTATSIGDATKWDAIKMVIRVRVKRQPDGWIRLPGSPWRGDDIHNTTGAGQNYTQRIGAVGKAVYHLYWQNDGNVVDTLRVRGPGDDGYWKVRYYDAFRDGTDITSQVTGTGWETAPTAPGGKRSMRVEVSVDSGAPSGIARTIRIRGISIADSKKLDVVKAKTVVR